MTKDELIAFEAEVARRFEAKEIAGPVHLSGGNEDALIEIFSGISREDWIFSTYRSHYHALLHGIPPDEIMAQIVAGRSMNLSFPAHRFYTSAIVGGHLSVATGVALGLKRKQQYEGGLLNRHLTAPKVWCFCGDMAATTGAFHEASKYAERQDLPIQFVIEDNGLSCDSPTFECWGKEKPQSHKIIYQYKREWPHVGIGKYIAF